MKTALLVLCVAILATAAVAGAPLPNASPAASAQLCSADDAPATSLAAALFEVGTPPMEPRIACVPTCPYYQSYCQELCTDRGGIKSFTCTPAPPGLCATYSCTCNKGL